MAPRENEFDTPVLKVNTEEYCHDFEVDKGFFLLRLHLFTYRE